jgi:hypothetical protein
MFFFLLTNGLLPHGMVFNIWKNKNIFGPSNSYVSDLHTWHLIKGFDFPRS